MNSDERGQYRWVRIGNLGLETFCSHVDIHKTLAYLNVSITKAYKIENYVHFN